MELLPYWEEFGRSPSTALARLAWPPRLHRWRGAVKRRQIVELGDRVPIDDGTFAEGFVSPGLKSRRRVFAHLDSADLAGGTAQLGNRPIPLYLADRGSPCSALSSPAWMM